MLGQAETPPDILAPALALPADATVWATAGFLEGAWLGLALNDGAVWNVAPYAA